MNRSSAGGNEDAGGSGRGEDRGRRGNGRREDRGDGRREDRGDDGAAGDSRTEDLLKRIPRRARATFNPPPPPGERGSADSTERRSARSTERQTVQGLVRGSLSVGGASANGDGDRQHGGSRDE